MRFLVYEVSVDAIRLIDVRSAVETDLADDKNAWRAGVYPIKKIEGGEAIEILTEIQNVMGSSPPPWLTKILGVNEKDRLKYYKGEELNVE